MMITLNLTTEEEKVLMDALQSYRNKLARERKYDGVTTTAHNKMINQIDAADDLMGKIGDL